MPRKARKKSCLCTHHIILRGINRQIIFEDKYDYLQFISILKYYKEICDFKLYAYCLMDNHILDLFSNHSECIKYLHTISNEKCLENFSSFRLPDTEALKIIQTKTSCNSPSDFQHLELSTRNQYLKQLFQSGISVRQLSRLTGISRTAINSSIQ